MAIAYSMEAINEAKRLERQAEGDNYSVEKELKGITFDEGDRVLDAGCGSGLLSRYIRKNKIVSEVHAFDFSELRVKQAQSEAAFMDVRFWVDNIENIEVAQENHYSKIFSRYVFQHLEKPINAAKCLYRSLEGGGALYLIDADGVLFNLCTQNVELNRYLDKLKNKIPMNLFVGRDLPKILSQAGFEKENISYEVHTMNCSGDSRQFEVNQYRERLAMAMPMLEKILGSKANRFVELYLLEASDEMNPLFYNKFIVKAVK